MALDYRELTVWNEAMRVAELVYAVSARFPTTERHGLMSQVRRAAVSIPSCIAEGNARGSTRDYLRFLSMAAGSIAELQTQLLLAQRLGFMTHTEHGEVDAALGGVARLLQSMRNRLRSKVSEDPALFPDPRSPFPASP